MKTRLIIVMLLMAISVFGQTNQTSVEAFKRSYELEDSADYAMAIKVLKDIFVDSSYEFNIRLGWLSYLSEDYINSHKYYERAIELLPYAIEAKLGSVLPLAAMGNWNEVITIYEQILAIDPQNTLTNYRIGVIYYERGEFDKAFPYVEKVVNLYPFDYDSVILFAWINLRLSNFRQAEVLFDKSLLILPDNESATEGLKLIQ